MLQKFPPPLSKMTIFSSPFSSKSSNDVEKNKKYKHTKSRHIRKENSLIYSASRTSCHFSKGESWEKESRMSDKHRKLLIFFSPLKLLLSFIDLLIYACLKKKRLTFRIFDLPENPVQKFYLFSSFFFMLLDCVDGNG